jgi:hypothetical protein
MHPHTPQDRRAFESPELDAPVPPAERGGTRKRRPSMALSMLFAALLLAAIVVLTILI